MTYGLERETSMDQSLMGIIYLFGIKKLKDTQYTIIIIIIITFGAKLKYLNAATDTIQSHLKTLIYNHNIVYTTMIFY